MKKILLAIFTFTLLSSFALTSYAQPNQKSLYQGIAYAAGKQIDLKSIYYPTDIYIINNTSEFVDIELPNSYFKDLIAPNGVYRIKSDTRIPSTFIRLWHPFYKIPMDKAASDHSILSLSNQYDGLHLITISY